MKRILALDCHNKTIFQTFSMDEDLSGYLEETLLRNLQGATPKRQNLGYAQIPFSHEIYTTYLFFLSLQGLV